ncbi:MAG: SpoIIE family protein phosphatase [Bdellovibrionales bacterium]
MSSAAKKESHKTEVITLTDKDRMLDPRIQVPPCLVLISGDPNSVGRQWNLIKPNTTLGRTDESDIHLGEGGLSKSHAQFSREGMNITVTDLGSTNKTIVNGTTLTPNQPHKIKNNDLIQAGKLFFKFLEKGVVTETAEKARMQAELETARNVQARVLPETAEAVYGTVRVGGRYRSATEVGGDWWWHWGAGDKAFLIVGDVTGHGAGAALITSAARSAVSTFEHDETVTIDKVYNTLTRAIHTCSTGDIVMSAFLVEYQTKTNILQFMNASHVPSALFPPGASDLSHLVMLDCKSTPPLGSSAGAMTVAKAKIPPGSRLVLLTDGITERKNTAGRMIREKEFYKMLFETHQAHEKQSQFLDQLMAQSDAIAQNAELADDITIAAMDFF